VAEDEEDAADLGAEFLGGVSELAEEDADEVGEGSGLAGHGSAGALDGADEESADVDRGLVAERGGDDADVHPEGMRVPHAHVLVLADLLHLDQIGPCCETLLHSRWIL
jgi:hypothetical protein